MELLVVICLMGLLSAGAVSVFSSSATVGSINNGSDILTGTLREAQLLAYSSQVPTGVIIENSPGSSTNLRRMAVVEQVNGAWQIASKTHTLPAGICFIPSVSSEGVSSSGTQMPVGQLSTVALPGQATGSQNYFFQFDAEGFADPAGGQAVLAAAVVNSSGTPTPKRGMGRLLTIRKLGQVMSYDYNP